MLNKLNRVITIRKSKRLGRGIGSTKGGHTVGRGQKGHKSRTGYKSPRPGFEGGQMPLSRRLPKLPGFSRSYFQKKMSAKVITLDELNKFNDNDKITIEFLKEKGFVNKNSNGIVKILNNGELSKKLHLEGIKVSAAAKTKIEKAGGSVS